MFPFARPFPLPSLPFDERAWTFDLPAKEETVLQSTGPHSVTKPLYGTGGEKTGAEDKTDLNNYFTWSLQMFD